MNQGWGQNPSGFQYPMQTGFQQPQQTGYPGAQFQQQSLQRSQFAGIQPQQTGFPGAQMLQAQPTGYVSLQRPMMTGAPPPVPPLPGAYSNPSALPPVPPLPSGLGAPNQPNRFMNASPGGFGGPPQGYQPPAPLIAQPTGFMDPRLTMMGATFLPTSAGGTYQGGGISSGLPQFGGASLQQSIAQHNQDKRGTSTQQIPWALTKAERKQYDQIFRAWDQSGNGFLEGAKALEVFGASGLDKDDLARIWSLADADDRGKLNREEFHVAMGLIYRRLNGNELPVTLPPELVPASAKSLGESVMDLQGLLKNDNYGRSTNDSRGKVRTFNQGEGTATSRKDGTVYRYDDDADTPAYRSSSRHVDRSAVRTGTESPANDVAEMQRQLENAAKRIDRITTEQASRSMEDEALDRELDDLRRRVKRVQDDLDYVSRGPRSFEKDEDRRKLERELLSLLHERLPEVQRKIEDRERRKKREKEEWASDRDRRNGTSGRYAGDRDRDRDEYRRYDDYDRRRNDRDEEDRGYMRGTFGRDRSRERGDDRYRDERSYGRDRDSGRDSGRDDYGRDRGYDREKDRDRPRSPPQTRSPPPAPPAAPKVETARSPPPVAPSPSITATKNMTPEERQAFIRAEAARRLEERQQRLGLIAPPSATSTPSHDNAIEERLAREKKEAEEKARKAEQEAEEREKARKARLAGEKGLDSSSPAPPAPPFAAAAAAPSPPVPSSPASPATFGKKKAPPPPAPRSALKGSSLPSALRKAAAPPPPRATPVAPTPPAPPASVAPPAPVAVAPAVDPEEEAFKARQAALQKARDERAARLRELEKMEEDARQEEQRYQARMQALSNRSATSTPIPASPAPPVPPVPPTSVQAAPAQPPAGGASTNPFYRMQQGGAAATPSTPSSGFNPFSRPSAGGTIGQPAVNTPPSTSPAPPPAPLPPPAPTPPVVQTPAKAPSPPLPPPAPVQPATSMPPPQKPSYQRAPADSDDEWDSVVEKEDDEDSSDDDRTKRQNLAAALFGSSAPPTARSDSRASNPRSNTQTPAPITPTATNAAAAPPAPPPPAPPAPPPAPFSIPPPAEYAAPAPPPAPVAPPPPMAPMVPPAPSASAGAPPAAVEGRSALLQSIASGARLRPTKTVDKSIVQGAGAVLGDTAPPPHIINPPKAPSPPPQQYPSPQQYGNPYGEPAAAASNGHAHKDSVDWYADLAAEAGAAQPPTLDSVQEEPSSVPVINVHEPVASEADPLEDVDMNTSHRVRSLYPYEGQRAEDLSFGENMIIVAHPSKSGGPWWYGNAVLSGQKGFFPNSYVQIMDEIQVVALYDYQGTTPEEFSFQEGQKITIIDRSEEGWWRTEQNGQILLVPAAYLELASVFEGMEKAQQQEQMEGRGDTSLNSVTPSMSSQSEAALESSSTQDGWSEDSSDEWSSEDDSEDESNLTDAQRQEERRQREIERQRVLEAAGLIVKQSTEARPPRPPVRARSTSKRAPKTLIISPSEDRLPLKNIYEHRDLPPLPPPTPRTPNTTTTTGRKTRNVDDAYGRYEAFKAQEGNAAANNRLSIISEPSTYASTVPPSSPRQDLSPRTPATPLPPSVSPVSTVSTQVAGSAHGESKISTLLNFLGRSRTPGEKGDNSGSSTVMERKIISGPMPLSSPSREASPAFGSSWSSIVDKDALKDIPPHERKRQEAIFELINTESAYVRDLQLIVEVFYANVMSLLNEKEMKIIFANIEDILLTNTAFLSQLEERQKECRLYIDIIGDLLDTHISAMGVYMQYCVHQSHAIKVLQSLRGDKPELAAKLHHLREHDPAVRSLDLSSYLLIPMQRITRYPLLIRQILNYTQHGQDREKIDGALQAAEIILEAINESIREQEGTDRLKELSKALWVGEGQLDLTAPTRFMGPRRLLKEGLVTKAKSKKRLRAVLCSDILVLVEESTGTVYRMPIPLSDVTVHEIPGSRDDLAFMLSTSYPRGGSNVNLRALTARDCQNWMKAIEEARIKCLDAAKNHVQQHGRGNGSIG